MNYDEIIDTAIKLAAREGYVNGITQVDVINENSLSTATNTIIAANVRNFLFLSAVNISYNTSTGLTNDVNNNWSIDLAPIFNGTLRRVRSTIDSQLNRSLTNNINSPVYMDNIWAGGIRINKNGAPSNLNVVVSGVRVLFNA